MTPKHRHYAECPGCMAEVDVECDAPQSDLDALVERVIEAVEVFAHHRMEGLDGFGNYMLQDLLMAIRAAALPPETKGTK